MNIISREQWNARNATGHVERTAWANRKGVVFHHTTGPASQTPRDIQHVHQAGRGWFDAGYNFLIDHEGKIYEGRGWSSVGAHCEGHNTSTIGIAFIGDYRNGHDTFTEAMKLSGAWLYQEAVRRRRGTLDYAGHQEMSGASTECPGHQVMAWIDAHGPKKLPGKTAGKHTSPKKATTETEDIVKELETLKRGDDGRAVTRAQALLNCGGASPSLSLDGDFGPRTDTEARKFQERHGLDSDGIVGPKTWAALLGVS